MCNISSSFLSFYTFKNKCHLFFMTQDRATWFPLITVLLDSTVPEVSCQGHQVTFYAGKVISVRWGLSFRFTAPMGHTSGARVKPHVTSVRKDFTVTLWQVN